MPPHLENGSCSVPDIWHREITRMGIVSCGQRDSTVRRGLSPDKKPEGLGFKLGLKSLGVY